MNTFKLNSSRVLEHIKKENLYERENKITSFKFILPETIGNYNRADCEIELRCYIEGDDYIPYAVDTDNAETEVVITTDLTETAQIVPLMLYITHSGEVIGKTNEIPFVIHNSKADTPPLTPREEFDTVIREQRAEIAEQAETISEQASQIEQDEQTISELNTQVSELTTENEQLETQHTADQNTIQYLIENPPEAHLQPKSVTPTAQMQVVEPDEGYQGLSTVTVGAVTPPRLQGKAVNPSFVMQNVQPDSGYDGLSNVAVGGVTAEIDSNIQPQNIKEGVDILGVEGTYNPFPEHSVGGIYITEIDEDTGYPMSYLIENWNDYDNVGFFKFYPNVSKGYLDTVIFKNCNILSFSTSYQFLYQTSIKKVVLPDTLTILGRYALSSCSRLENVDCPQNLKTLGENSIESDPLLKQVIINHGCETLYYTIRNNPQLKTVNIPNTITSITGSFSNCGNLEFVTIENDFNANGLNLSGSTLYSVETIVSWLEALADRTGETAYTLIIGPTNINKLTAEQRAIATNKNWNLA